MSDSIKILAGKSKSVDSVMDDKYINVSLTRNASPLIDSSTVGTLDLNERFLYERERCKDYRLILTINPFCTNVLFNACTEVMKNEGADDIKVVTEQNTVNVGDATGKRNSLTPYDMICNTEYSKDEIGYEYHPGMDMFNNHILRNKTYRIVNRLPDGQSPSDIFNTIEDFMRTETGEAVNRCCRNSAEDTALTPRHLYDYDDILPFETGEAVESNLQEVDGWFGFYNTNTIGNELGISRAINNKGNCEFIDMYPDRTLFSFTPKFNKHRNRLENNWDFQITYPYEHCTTYYDTNNRLKDFKLIQDGDTNALLIVSAEYVMGPQSENFLLFRTAVKHNLKAGDYIHLYYNEDEGDGHWHPTSTEIKEEYRVTGIGNLDADYQDYYFYLSDTSILDTIFATPKDHDGDSYTGWDYVKDYFYSPIDWADEYYIGQFDNTKEYIKGNLVKIGDVVHICTYNYMPGDRFDDCFHIFPNDETHEYVQYYSDDYGMTNIPQQQDCYIVVGGIFYELYNHDTQKAYHNATVDANQFIREIINSAFRNDDSISEAQDGSLWSDYISFRFTKSNGASECSYYVRKFKKVPNLKYGTNNQRGKVDFNFENEQYPLAFAQTIYGDGISQAVFTDNINVENLTDDMGREVTDIYVTIVKANRGYEEWYTNHTYNSAEIEYSHCFGPVTCGFKLFHLPDDSMEILNKTRELGDVNLINNYDTTGIHQTLGDKTNITINDEWFYGDVVEVCPWRGEVTPLCDVNFRFNTAQRELGDTDTYQLYYDEIRTDDLSGVGFVPNRHQTPPLSQNVVSRSEGYYYKPHYRLRLKGLGSIHQDTHKVVDVYKAEPIQANGIFIKIQTRLKHNVTGGRVLLRDRTTGDEWWLDVVNVLDAYNFIVNKISRDETPDRYRDWMTVCEGINNGMYVVRRENPEIPSYATKTGTATYIWRNAVNAWDVDNTDETLPTYTFANGCFYIDESINFFLNRQDLFGKYGLYYNGFMPDPKSEVITEQSIYEYKDESVTTC